MCDIPMTARDITCDIRPNIRHMRRLTSEEAFPARKADTLFLSPHLYTVELITTRLFLLFYSTPILQALA